MSYLLSPISIEDGIVSQCDLVDMLLYSCRLRGPCSDDDENDRHRDGLSFETLDIDLQLNFIEVICPPMNGKFDCVVDLYEMWLDIGIFGFAANYDDHALNDTVRETCLMTYPHAIEMGLAWPEAPMAEPSPIPSHSSPPTRAPSSEAPSHRSDPPSATARPTIPTLIVPLAPSTSSTSGGERGIVIGTSSALAVLLAASCVLLYAQYRRTARCPGYPNTIKDSPLGGRGPDRLVDEVREPWRKYHHHASTSLSMMSYIMGHNHCSSGSSSSSFRDYRFVAVFDPEGAPIPQFNPNTAAAVIIGSVTIGCADNSSFGSGPFADVGSSSIMSRSFFSLGGTMSRRRGSGTPVSEGGISSRDDVSSLSSRRSPKRANPNRYRSMNQRGGEGSTWLVDRRKRIGKRDPIGPSSMSSLSETSHYTVPVSHRRLRTIEGRVDDGDRQVSFGDWVAISNITEFRHRGSFTDAAAMLSQRKVFFNTLCPESVPSSKGLSLPDIHRVARVVSSDAGASSLSESYFQDAQQPTSPWQQAAAKTPIESVSNNHAFIPWRKEGFSPSLQLSDDRQSNETATSTTGSNSPDARKRLEFFRPAKAVFAKYTKRTNAKDWFSFKKRQYRYLRREHCIEDDSEVLSMNSYSSHINLLSLTAASRADLPNLVLGTFAAAAMPIGKQHLVSSQPIVAPFENNDEPGESLASLANDDTKNISSRSEPVMLHISSLDVGISHKGTDSESFSAYSRSDFESSAPSSSGPSSSGPSSSVPSSSMPSKIGEGWSDSSCNHSSLTSHSSPCIFEIATSPLVSFVDSQNETTAFTEVVEDFVEPTADDTLKTASHQLSLSEPSFTSSISQDIQNETNIVSRSGSDSDDAMYNLDEENSGFLPVNPGLDQLLKSSRSGIAGGEAESVLLEGGFHLVDE
ncbi:hypothetical protein ACHAXA_006883 [Cyclostephanos tholiformis]|uniref:Uncharacterized protein n=1 Tax=Cyclostephanos tholiformis TaxID=382380 RepID=A0ABD3SD40_9STRA